ncbi:hypothetical protein [Lutibacter sp.]|uniref:hypothetical protein n=1 Tax=Lutibacter sp. TaxID=1925666 RepID=UPI002736059F|nr:hypothetical protein [Lutibacter sp.]MDP3314381.1 hypothetical protein [Lutibacter sp.]
MKLFTVLTIILLQYSCGDESKDDINIIEEPNSVKLIKDILYSGSESGSHFYYEDNKLTKSSVLNRGNYEVYTYNSNNKISKIKQYYDNSNVPNNSVALNFNYASNFNDNEYLIEYVWLNNNAFKSRSKQYNFDSKGLVQSVECSDSDCESVNIYYKNNQIDKVIYNEGKSYQSIYTFEFDDGINPMNILFRKFGYVEYINIQVFDYFFDFYYINNATKIYRDGTLVYTANYQYNSDNYPIQVTYVRVSNGETGKAVFTY